MIIPERIILETVHGCNARCTMCPVSYSSKRKKGIMSFELFSAIVDNMIPYKEHIGMVDLFGMGEPLLDKELPQKIHYAKEKGVHNLAIATNADLLTAELARQLYDAGLDTIIFSIDGVRKETHEAIRINTSFERVVKNAEEALIQRDQGRYATRFIFRFIRQERNREEWEEFRRFWKVKISKEKNDKISSYDMHSWGGEISLPGEKSVKRVPDSLPCHHIFDHLIVLWDGTVPLCCADMPYAHYKLGNVHEMPSIEIFNNSKAQQFRKIHETGKRRSLKICAECTILESEERRAFE